MIDYGGDGFRQHYRALLYQSDYLKNILYELFNNHRLVIPQWDFSIGEGSDILQTLHYYGFGDVFYLLSVFIPNNKMYIFYDFIVLFKLFLAGIAFSSLCFYKKHHNVIAILSGTFIYLYCSFSMMNITGHVFFINSLLYFPLIILGVEKIIEKDNPLFISIFVCLAALSNIYFFYMMVLLTATYTLVRVINLDNNIKDKLMLLIKVTLYSFLGVLLSCFIFLPILYSMLGNDRLVEHQTSLRLIYDLKYYRNLIAHFSFNISDYFGGYSIISLFALFALFKNKDKKVTKILSLICIVFILLPIFGLIFNAFMYVTDRWLFAFALMIAYIVVDCFDDIYNLNIYESAIIIIYFVLCLFIGKDQWQVYALYLFGSVVITFVIKIIKNKTITDLAILLSVVFTTLFTIVYMYSPIWWNITKNGADINTIKENTYIDIGVNDESFYRAASNDLETNISVNSHLNTSQYYWSISNGNVIDFRRYLGLSDRNNHHYDNYDERYILHTLSSSKYFVSKDELNPYGFTFNTNMNGYNLFRNNNPLSLMYVYKKSMLKKDWLKLDMVDKQEALLEYAVVENKDKLNSNDFNSNIINVDFVMNKNNLDINDNTIVVDRNDAYLDLKVDSKGSGEYYLVIDNLDSNVDSNIPITFSKGEKFVIFKSKSHNAYADKHDFIINLGYHDGFIDDIKINFVDKGKFTFNSIRVVCEPLIDIKNQINDLNDLTIKKLSITNNKVDAELNVDEDSLLCISIPYTKGWKMYVDGNKVDIEKVNIMYMGTYLNKGSHNVELVYDTPLLKMSSAISAISLVAYIYLIIKQRNIH